MKINDSQVYCSRPGLHLLLNHLLSSFIGTNIVLLILFKIHYYKIDVIGNARQSNYDKKRKAVLAQNISEDAVSPENMDRERTGSYTFEFTII